MTEVTNCQICWKRTPKRQRNGSYPCETCRRFYYRYRDSIGDIVCQRGDNRCLEVCANKTTRIGTVWRLMCTRCRFNKCQMYFSCEKSKPGSVVAKVSQPELSEAEIQLQSLVFNAWNYKEAFETKVPLHKTQFGNGHASLTSMLSSLIRDGYSHAIYFAAQYAKSLPGYSELALQDRVGLFSLANPKWSAVEACGFGRSTPLPLSINPDQFRSIVPIVPELSYMTEEYKLMWLFFQEWAPTPAEYGFLMAFIFVFGSTDERIINLLSVRKMQSQLRQLYNLYIHKTFGNSSAASSRLHRMCRALGMLQESADRRSSAYTAVFTRVRQMVVSADEMNEFNVFMRMWTEFGQQHQRLLGDIELPVIP